MGLRDIATALGAYRKLTEKEKGVFKAETKTRRRKKKATRKKRVSKKATEAPAAPKQKKKGRKKKGQRQPSPDQFAPEDPDKGFTQGLDGPRADPLRDVHPE